MKDTILLDITPGTPLALSSTSKGDAMKWYLPEKDAFVKANRFDHGREYQDSIAEVIAARLAVQMGIPAVEYQLCRIHLEDGSTVLGTISPNFCEPEEQYISFETMVESSYEPVHWGVSAQENYELVLKWFHNLTGQDAHAYLDTMLLFDFLICNEDRHLNNFGILYHTAEQRYRFPPLFDNGYSLGFLQSEQKPAAQYLYSCKAKPFSTSFSKQLHLIDSMPEGVVLPEQIPDDLWDGLPLPKTSIQYCSEILTIRLAQLKEYFSCRR